MSEDNFEKQFKWAQRIAILWGIFIIGVIIFLYWLAYKVVMHFIK